MTTPNGPVEKHGKTVAFLGPIASYTHAAALQRYHDSDFELKPVTTIEDIFAAVANGDADRGVVPFENSTNGIVPATLDLFANASGKYNGIVVIGEEYVAVNHCIVGLLADNTLKDVTKRSLSHITTLYSHPQAWGQCTQFLSTHLPTAEHLDTSSTSRAAELVSLAKDSSIAAISSALAAEHYKLDILAGSIQNTSNNTTRFLIIRQEATSSLAKQPPDADTDVAPGKWKTLISFTVP
ncbi:prephenate dehydratase, partial [Oleoguttula sp. CCFEE 5521]